MPLQIYTVYIFIIKIGLGVNKYRPIVLTDASKHHLDFVASNVTKLCVHRIT